MANETLSTDHSETILSPLIDRNGSVANMTVYCGHIFAVGQIYVYCWFLLDVSSWRAKALIGRAMG